MKVFLDEETQKKLTQDLDDLKTLELAEPNDLLNGAIRDIQELLDKDSCKGIIWDRKKHQPFRPEKGK
jgi:hypothetical protein